MRNSTPTTDYIACAERQSTKGASAAAGRSGIRVGACGRLAIASAYQGRGLGEILLLDAIRRIVRATATIAVYAVIVDAKNDRARAFYARYGFRPFASIPRRLFLPLQTFEKLGL